ncbi:TetR/AcrR family transcriptional regulator [Mycobacterium sp. GA-2829]|uniref:TetR/AcrR family transcriptional regulator n=1 Tax=Mycobacterium sp. GA-2829 TaxID=1772283 RepID=UPI0007401B00|nr:TetR/AcrR family transcriptional regulator [Mycobacterium sp. GA-2829]KUI32605.1 TetR family transcriptional regulator [Mycobacterium sp. GA-2829]
MTAHPTTIDSSPAEQPLRDQVCAAALEYFGRAGFDQSMAQLTTATGVADSTLRDLFGSPEGLREACDDYLMETVRRAKTAAVTSHDPSSWSAQLANIESYAPLLSYLVRSLEGGDQAGRNLLQHMTDNAQEYLEAGVAAGTLRPTADPRGRARLLAMFGGGAFLLYRKLHPDPTDMAAVVRDYARDLLMPTLELYTYGLMADDAMYRALTDARKEGADHADTRS